jgi:Protein of unknown function (DUF1552)
MSTPRWLIDRRTMLKGIGVTMALPLLNVMMAPRGYGVDAAKVVPRKVPVRFCAMYVPNGLTVNKNDKNDKNEKGVDYWTPKDGSLTTLPEVLAPLDKVRNSVVVLGGMRNALPLKTAPVHITRPVGFLCSSLVDGGIKAGKGAVLNSGSASIDQVIAQHLGQVTKIPSLELSMDAPEKGFGRSGDNLVYGSHLSWSNPSTPVEPEIIPKAVFDRLFRSQFAGDKNKPIDTPSAIDDHSVLDAVIENLTSFRTGLGIEDKRKLEEYATSVRELEKRLEREMKSASAPRKIDPAALRSLAELDQRVGKVSDVGGRRSDAPLLSKLMMDILALAFWTDSTRICTFLWGREGSHRNFSFLDGVSGAHHPISHHDNIPDKEKTYLKVCTWHIEQYAYLVNRLGELKEGADTVLDNSMLLIGAGMRDGNRHDGQNLPILLAGGGGRTIKGGRHLNFPGEPLANLHCEIAARMGLQLKSFADSTGPLKGL